MESSRPEPQRQSHGHPQHHRPLAESIAVSTRSVHARLNKLIIARLPLALPPRAADPAIYVSGLLHIAPIYVTFERLWQNILDTTPTLDPGATNSDRCDPELPLMDSKSAALEDRQPGIGAGHKAPTCTRIHSLLQHLYLPGLMRSDRLKADIASLTGWPGHVVEEQLKSVGQTSRLGEFTQHIKRAIENRPHVLLAYSYILYMALFAGGRFIRASLESVGEDFWQQLPSPVMPTGLSCQKSTKPTERASGFTDEELPENTHHSHADHKMPLRFLHFKSAEDGEDLKREFKRRLLDSENILTDSEKHDIVQEAVCIFENMTLMIDQLDGVCASSYRSDAEVGTWVEALAGVVNPISARFRDSIAVAKERCPRPSRMSSSDDSTCSIVKEARGTRQTDSSGLAQCDHPPMPSVADVELCPALSKSVRFEKALPKPTRSPTYPANAGSNFDECLKLTSRRLHGVHVANWLMMVAFGAIVIGAFVSGRGGSVV
ncbi:hypothetical protein AK830_g2491 [Neonectria ditissima]|uniref:Heme oxygenase n=1 Tax=Neonectria ditissima TaxID=78410 RepID=A0A0P7BVF4_9HYPO|nr:hypothetical protein AK830_g2491 [Neonectria ditissima]